MISDRMVAALRLLQGDDWSDEGVGVAAAAAAALAVDGVAVALETAAGRTEVLWCSDDVSRGFEELQLTLGEGPGHDCVAGGTAIRVADLARVRHDRWPALIMEAPDRAARAVFCFPLRIGAISLGVLTAVRRTPGRLTRQQSDDATLLAGALTMRFLERGGPALEPQGAGGSLPFLQHAVVHQATGMVSVQLAVPLAQALLRQRAFAYAYGRSLTDVSHDIVAKRLRLTPDAAPSPPAADKD